MMNRFHPRNLRVFAADHSHIRSLSPTRIHDGHSAPHPPQTLEEVSSSPLGGCERFARIIDVFSLRLQRGGSSSRHLVSSVPHPRERPAG